MLQKQPPAKTAAAIPGGGAGAGRVLSLAKDTKGTKDTKAKIKTTPEYDLTLTRSPRHHSTTSRRCRGRFDLTHSLPHQSGRRRRCRRVRSSRPGSSPDTADGIPRRSRTRAREVFQS